ncbi:MAG: hypothetical protein JJE51_10335 [Thermoanaerobaculia bacterium]|nr:hypothetical protein [Thermoanaerobaculia bacterium]
MRRFYLERGGEAAEVFPRGKSVAAILLIAFAVWGIAIAIAAIPLLSGPALEGQTHSYATRIGLDARAPSRFVILLIALPIVVPLVMRLLIARLAAADTKSWARVSVVIACAASLWTAIISPSLVWVIVPAAAVFTAAVTLRRHAAAFTRHDAVLLPTFAAILLSVIDASDLPVDHAALAAALTLFTIRIALSFIPSQLPVAFAFLLSPLALVLQTSFIPAQQRYLGWPALLLAVVSPWLLRGILRERHRPASILAIVIYPIAAYAYMNAVSMLTAEGAPRVSFFEDAHHLMTASEMIRGEKLYRDVVPVHGLIEDGLFSYVAMRGGVNAGQALTRRTAVIHLNAIAVYAVAACAAGTAEVGIVAFFVSAMLGAVPLSLRPLAALASLAFLCYAARRRRAGPFAVAAALAVVAFFTSLDFGTYTALAIVIAAVRSPIRKRALIAAAAGAATALVVAFGALSVAGIADDFFRVTFRELPTAAQTVTLNVFAPSDWLARTRTLPEALGGIASDRLTFWIAVWIGALFFVSSSVMRRASRRIEPLVILAVWSVLAGVSYAQRHHLFFQYAAVPLLVVAGWSMLRRRITAAWVVIVIVLLAAQPTSHLAIGGWLRRTRTILDPGWTRIESPRAKGALFAQADSVTTAIVQRYVDTRLAPHETFFDFTDRPMLYFLVRRDCPVRQPFVAFYQDERLQREVIARIRSNPDVKAALVGPGGMDGVPNNERASLVWDYLKKNFEPDSQTGDVIFWRRK